MFGIRNTDQAVQDEPHLDSIIRSTIALYLISYDIADKDAFEYDKLWGKLDEMGAVKILYSEYIITAESTKLKAFTTKLLHLPCSRIDCGYRSSHQTPIGTISESAMQTSKNGYRMLVADQKDQKGTA